MKVMLYTLHDLKSGSFSPPMAYPARGAAVRDFEDMVNQPSRGDQKNNIYEHPADFLLFEIGSFDPLSGELEPAIEKVNLGSGANYAKARIGVVE